jgi:hypothetical protein
MKGLIELKYYVVIDLWSRVRTTFPLGTCSISAFLKINYLMHFAFVKDKLGYGLLGKPNYILREMIISRGFLIGRPNVLEDMVNQSPLTIWTSRTLLLAKSREIIRNA